MQPESLSPVLGRARKEEGGREKDEITGNNVQDWYGQMILHNAGSTMNPIRINVEKRDKLQTFQILIERENFYDGDLTYENVRKTNVSL